MKSCAMVCLVLVCCVNSIFGQDEVSNSWEAQYHAGLEAYRNACLEPANEAIVLTFDSVALVLLDKEPTSAVAAGMHATAQLMLAESMWNPLDKLTQFQSWKPKLEAAIAADPNNADLRFFRLSVQFTVPALLEYRSNMTEDEQLTRTAFANGQWSTDIEHQTFISSFLDQL
jgi:hypothetical protein